jgi:DNA-binding CsgD family transcriptional regulator
MRDRSPREAASIVTSAVSGDGAGCVARFVLDDRYFQLTICDQKEASVPAEVARFHLGDLTVAVLEDFDPPKESFVEAREMIGRLTQRELQIAAMVAQGDATKNIAYKLRISEWTVGTHLRRICAKLHVHNRAAMVYRCASLIKSAAEVASSHCDLHAPK